MVLIPVLCPICGHDKISKRGKTENGKQRYFMSASRMLCQESLLRNSFVHPCKEECHLVFKLKKHV
jgi:hypothetical protein